MKTVTQFLEEDLSTGRNVLLTGPAGTGKSHAINNIVKESSKRFAMTASTGIAASNISGTTIHSFCGLTPDSEKSDIKGVIEKTEKGQQIKDRVKNIDVLVIDEISMLSPEVLEMVDETFKCSIGNNQPFGGKQIIMSGDFLQIPPVYNKQIDSKSIWAFQSEAWNNANISVIYTDKVYRQDNLNFINALNEIRVGKTSSDITEMMQGRVGVKLETNSKPLKFLPRNKEVDLINANELTLLRGEEKVYEARIYGKNSYLQKQIRANCIAAEMLTLKKDAQVIILKNDHEGLYFNGSLGRVVKFEDGNPVVKIDKTGKEICFEYAKWEVRGPGGEIQASFEQIPLKLAYALTIHKSQGMTLECAEVDPRGIFTEGQLYVALSRVKTLEGLKLLGWQNKYIKANKTALEFYEQLNSLVNNTEE